MHAGDATILANANPKGKKGNKDEKSQGMVKKSGTHKTDLKVTKKPKSDKAKRDKPAWMTKAPSATEKGKSKTIDSKYYWWCDALACW